MNESITLRSHLIGKLNDLVESAQLGTLGKCSLICELVCLFADYEEEGAAIFLDAFLTDNLEALTAMIPQSTCLKLGKTSCDEPGVKRAVKRAAPLVRGCWKMFLAMSGNKLEFGLFRDSAHPLNVPLNVALQTGGSGDAKFIRITKLARATVRASTHAGDASVIHFTNSKEATSEGENSIEKLCGIICSDLDEKLAQSCKTYLESLLSTAVRESHGALIVVVERPKTPPFLSDCTNLEPQISLSKAVESVRRDPSTIPQLYALESVVCGMLCCDGIVVFDTKANVIAYNAFIKLKASNVVGGARRRAYQALCDRIGKGIKAAFFQSQDGGSEQRS